MVYHLLAELSISINSQKKTCKMKIKDSVTFSKLSPQIILALIIANDLYASYEVELVITSIDDSVHSITSLHYTGFAVDLRISNLAPGQAALIVKELKKKMPNGFYILLEIDHIHIEYDPN